MSARRIGTQSAVCTPSSKPGVRGDQRVRFRSLGAGRGGNVNHVGVELAQRDERHFASAKRRHEFFAIRRDAFALVPLREAQIQRGFFFEHARAAGPRAEAMHEPAELSERARFHHLQAARPANRPGGAAVARRRAVFARDGAAS